MACRTESKEIDGHSISVTQFPARQGLKVKARLLRLIGPALDALPSREQATSDFTKLAQHLDPDAIVQLCEDLLIYTKINGKEITATIIDTEFAGEYITLYKVIGYVVEVNSFFGKGGIGKLLEKVKITTLPTISPSL